MLWSAIFILIMKLAYTNFKQLPFLIKYRSQNIIFTRVLTLSFKINKLILNLFKLTRWFNI